MADGRIKISGGRVLISSAGKVATADACCCEPCTGCGNPQPDALVTVAGACGGCDCSGPYTFQAFADYPTYCHWHWRQDLGGGAGWDLHVYYCKLTSTWCSHIFLDLGGGGGFAYFGTDPNDCACVAGATDVTPHLACSGGDVVGTFQLIGDVAPGCGGCTATVTVGP